MQELRPLGLDIHLWLMIVAGLALFAELAFLRLRHTAVDFKDVVHSVAMGVSWSAVRMFGANAAMFGGWLWIYRSVAPWHLDVHNPLTWVAYWLVGDLVYYWTHRSEHRVRLLWSSHLIHHSSEQYNLATAVRMPWTEAFYKPIVAMWAPLLGFHPMMYVVFGAISLMVGQWQHLDWFPKVALVDQLFMSPSNHRVHHAKNPRYIDKNFGGSLVVWDRIFGTYEPETERPIYGVLHRPEAATTFKRSLGGYPELAAAMRRNGTVRGAARLALGRP